MRAALGFCFSGGSGLGVRDPPWPPDLEGGLGAAAGPTVVVECGRNGGRRWHRPPSWWRRPVGPGRRWGRHGDIPREAGLARR
jgi:hypothetical protein